MTIDAKINQLTQINATGWDVLHFNTKCLNALQLNQSCEHGKHPESTMTQLQDSFQKINTR